MRFSSSVLRAGNTIFKTQKNNGVLVEWSIADALKASEPEMAP